MSSEITTSQPDALGFIGLWDRGNPGSVYNRVPTSLQNAMDELPEKVRMMSEGKLRQEGRPSPQVEDARQRFWELYYQHETRRIPLGQVFKTSLGVYYYMLNNPHRLMWFLTPPTDLASAQRSMLEKTVNLVRGILKSDNLWIIKRKIKKNEDGSEEIDETRELNVKALAEVRKIMGDMTDRVYGTTVQRVAHAHHIDNVQGIGAMGPAEIIDAGSEEDDGGIIAVHDSLMNERSNVDEQEAIDKALADFMGDEPDE